VEAVKELLRQEGIESAEDMEIHDSFSYDGGELYHDLTIELVYDNILSVEQHYTQRMDRMSAPEIRFEISDYENWMPVEYQNHDTVPQVYEADETGIDGLDELIETWDNNLKQQFPAEEVAGGDSGE
jgi:glutaredoxin-related protein